MENQIKNLCGISTSTLWYLDPKKLHSTFENQNQKSHFDFITIRQLNSTNSERFTPHSTNKTKMNEILEPTSNEKEQTNEYSSRQ